MPALNINSGGSFTNAGVLYVQYTLGSSSVQEPLLTALQLLLSAVFQFLQLMVLVQEFYTSATVAPTEIS